MEANSIASRIAQQWIAFERVRLIDKYKVLVTFQSQEEMEAALMDGKDILLEIFAKVRNGLWRKCVKSGGCGLSVRVPLHGWSTFNLEKIGDMWGRWVCYNDNTRNNNDCTSTKMLISTTFMPFINLWIYFVMDRVVYDVHVKETSWEFVNLWNVPKTA